MAANPQPPAASYIERRTGRKRIHLMPACPDPGCPRFGKPTAQINVYHLVIVKGGEGPIDIDLCECRASRSRGSPRGHYIHFGPEGQIATTLPRIPGKKGRYQLKGANGNIIETEWAASDETRKALSIASRKGWKGEKRKKARIRKVKKTFSLPEQIKLKSDNGKAVWRKRKAELLRARYEKLLSEKRAWMQCAGKYLLDHPDAKNTEVAKCLDSIGLLRKDGKRWVEAIRGHSLTNDFGDLRKLLGIPGGTFRRTKSVKSFVALT